MKIAIEPKKKKCKGQNKAYGWPGCGQETQYRTYGLCNSCYAKWLRLTPEGIEKVQKSILKATKPRRELESMGKERKERKGITTLLESVKQVCHRYIRERDKGKPCISCGTPWHDEFEAGHYFKSELYSSLRFYELNIHGQCVRCNRMNEGNLSQYTANLPSRIGEIEFKELRLLAEQEKQSNHKWDREELKQIRNFYKEKLKAL